ncbi:hypothetical protein CO054_03075 [Candidatus Shapirobacteria bacterium CG_4_9_14_0_2_um_filter_39_11]|uniref:Uncharacterized protein n=1 Tax=Candidatus Shapirobacteria bacterium CG_4_9_14_0_2_um_filter_39_11 TaxID=1974478 RepID=A0A2M8ERZ8_9BACT|nr:MAG: hypothetical protein CO054_03075 [Candidatus Shapirobacteria bacterium CG_4_9_14_0_2_um_filter_39_11]
MPYSLRIRNKAIGLRKKGFSLKEVSEKLKIAKSTASAWLSEIELSPAAKRRLAKRRILGQYKTALLKKKLKDKLKRVREEKAQEMLRKIPFSKKITKLLCAFLWWCEGNKETDFVRFTSSDIKLVQNFLSLLRRGFKVDESKFRALVHLHSYHQDGRQKRFWSEITKIPLNQFYKSFKKPNTGRRKQKNYPGCLAISYYDARVAKELEAIYNAFNNFRPVR